MAQEQAQRRSEPPQKLPQADPANDVVITRVFDAPRALVWKAWTDPAALAEWWGPKGCKVNVSRVELRPGGMFLYNMQMPNMPAMWGKFVYREISPTTHMVFVNSFSDEHGGTKPNPWMPVYPLEVLNDLAFTEREGKTTLVLRGHPINANAEEFAMFLKARPNMQQGFNGTFEKLDAYLKNASVAGGK